MRPIPFDPDSELAVTVVEPCEHAPPEATVHPTAAGCEDCLADNREDWVHLRVCLGCGHVGCCDSSPGKHATAHRSTTGHPVIRSLEQGETWAWCYEDRRTLETRPLDLPRA